MARVFLSHSSRDNAAAAELKAWLDGQGFASAFLDFDKHSGIPPGADWERTLYEQIQRCQALLILQSPNWSASKWCFAEFTQARALGKPIVQVVESEAAAAEAPIAASLQRLDLRHDRSAGLEQLRHVLQKIAVQDQGGFDWPPPADPARPPFPGLMVFEEQDAPVFFGRDDDWRKVIERLEIRRVQGGPQLLVLQGSSGAGKSSLLRAGVLPRLRRAGRQWLVLPVLRPQARPLEALAQGLALALKRPEAWRELLQQLRAGLAAPSPEPALAALFAGWAADLRLGAAAPEAQLLLPIDQGEELFTQAEPAARQEFVAVLMAALQPSLPLQAVITIRADAMGSLQAVPELVNRFEPLPLGPLSLERYREIIEGPARVAGLRADPAFVERAIHDTATEDALPLLAFALRRLHDLYGADGDLSLSDYQALGDAATGLSPLENAVKQAADGVLQAQRPDAAAQKALRDAFVPAMVRVSEQGLFARRAAAWASLPEAARPLLEALVSARLLVKRQGEEQGSTVEVAHEALLRVWPLLRDWLAESREFLLGSQQLEQDLAQWQAAPPAQKPQALLSGLKLARGNAWLKERPDQLPPDLRTFIATSQRRAVRLRRLWVGAGTAVALLISGAGGFSFVQLRRAEAAQAAQFEATHRALSASDPFLSVVYGLAAAKPLLDGRKPWEAAQLSQTLLKAVNLNKERSLPLQTNQGLIKGMTTLPGGSIVTAGKDNIITWSPRGVKEREYPLESGGISFLRGGAYVAYNLDQPDGDSWFWGSLSFWKNDKRKAQFRFRQSNTTVVYELRNGDVLSGDDHGTVRRWRDRQAAGVLMQPGAGAVTAIVELENGDVMTGHASGKLLIWRNGKSLAKVLETNQGIIKALIQLPNGEIVSSGGSKLGSLALSSHGSFRRWRNGASVDNGVAIATGQGLVVSMLIADPHSIIAGGGDGSLKLWRFAGDKVSSIFVGAHSSSISALYRLDKNSFLSADSEGILRRWNDPSRVISASFLHATVTSPTLIFLESGDLVLGDGEAGKLKLWRRDGSVHDSIYIGSHGVTSLLEIRKNEILIGDKSGGIVAYKPTSRRGLNILPLPKKHRGQVDIMLKTGGNTFISVDSRTLFHWRYSHGGHSPRVASSLALPCKAGVNDVVLHRRSDILLLCFEGDIFSMHGGKAVRAMQLPPHKTGFRAIRLLSLPNGDLITTYQNGESQIWRSGSPLKSSFKIVGSGPRTRSPYLGIGPGRMMGGLDKANLALMSYQDWVSSVSGPLAPDEANLVRRWSTNFPVDTGQWLFVSSPVSVVTESDDTGYIANITASRRGELAVYLSGHQNKAKDGIVFLSLHSVVRSACGAVELGSLERRPELRGVAESAMTSCGLVLR